MVKRIWYWLTRYKLRDDEYGVWLRITSKAKLGFRQWYGETQGNDMCGPWIPCLTKEETNLLNKLYEKFYDDDYVSSLSISGSQEAYIKFRKIKNKIYY